MHGEFSRLTYDPRKHVAGVLQQQGRVGLDADWNEWVEAVLRRLRVETLDAIGGCGQPMHAHGFKVAITASGTEHPSVTFSAGRLYAGGLLAELEADISISDQLDWPIPDVNTWNKFFKNDHPWPGLDFSGLAAGQSRRDLMYAEVWLRHVTALVDEAERDQAVADANDVGKSPDWDARPEVGDLLRERALGGPDTCTRLRTVAQAKLWTINDDKVLDCEAAYKALKTALPPATVGRLQVNVQPSPPVKSPCEEPQLGGYAGAENRTYRIEIHTPGIPGTATFKYSTENGAFCLRIQADAWTKSQVKVTAGTNITIDSIGHDQVTQLKKDDWVEVCGEETELGMFRNDLVQVAINPIALANGLWQIQLTGDVVISKAPFLRRWSARDQAIALGTAFNLDDGSGLSVTFSGLAKDPFFHAQDYWIWAARVRTRDIEPAGLENSPQLSRGIERFYCSLAIVTWSKDAQGKVTGTVHACDHEFPPLTELTGLFYVSGDGQEAMPDLTQPNALVPLPQPLVAGVANGSWPVAQARVLFTIDKTSGHGQVMPHGGAPVGDGSQIEILTDPNGLAFCDWHIDSTNLSQQVKATLLDDAGNPLHLPLIYNANLSIASQVAYKPGNCSKTKDARNVQDAIDQLCRPDPGIHITDVSIGKIDPANDRQVDLQFLIDPGIVVTFDNDSKQKLLKLDRPICFVTMEVPQSLSRQGFFDAKPTLAAAAPIFVAFYQLIRLDSEIVIGDNSLDWRPAQGSALWLQNELPVLLEAVGNPLVLTRFTILGNFAGTDTLYLDGEAFRNLKSGPGGPVDLLLPSGDGKRGGNFEMWFWLKVPPIVRITSFVFDLSEGVGGVFSPTGTIKLSASLANLADLRIISGNDKVARVNAGTVKFTDATNTAVTFTVSTSGVSTNTQVTFAALTASNSLNATINVTIPQLIVGPPVIVSTAAPLKVNSVKFVRTPAVVVGTLADPKQMQVLSSGSSFNAIDVEFTAPPVNVSTDNFVVTLAGKPFTGRVTMTSPAVARFLSVPPGTDTFPDFPPGIYVVTLRGDGNQAIHSASARVLDGNPTQLPSGDGKDGGDFTFQFQMQTIG